MDREIFLMPLPLVPSELASLLIIMELLRSSEVLLAHSAKLGCVHHILDLDVLGL